ncbi:MAG: NAD+ synthase [Candidatus Omnitrophica bacterium]|nr:NAD+ synthase [Candidatus Omnitrophota bacterium]
MNTKKITTWIKKESKRRGKKGVVLGLSGGLDSAVTAVLCAKALGRTRVLCLILPSKSTKTALADAYSLVKTFRLKSRTINLAPLYKYSLGILPKAGRLACTNLLVRLRMLVLYYFANKLNYLVCGTSNKSEITVGYFTKYGDAASDILPLGNLLKTEVRELARDLGISERIIKKPPSADLWPGQTDEKEMGLNYNQLDDILERLEKNKKQKQPKVLVARIKSRIKATEHKRHFPKIYTSFNAPVAQLDRAQVS